jgi:hypothetical protein
MGVVLIDPGETVSLPEIKAGRMPRRKAPPQGGGGGAPPPSSNRTAAERYNNKFVRGIPNYYSQNMFAVSLAIELAMRHKKDTRASALRRRGIVDGIGLNISKTKNLQNSTLLHLLSGTESSIDDAKDALRLLMGVGRPGEDDDGVWPTLCSQVPIARRGDDIYGYTLPLSATDPVAVDATTPVDPNVQEDRFDVLRIPYSSVRDSQIKWDLRPNQHLAPPMDP